jgi:Family of unknown function (DUF6232)
MTEVRETTILQDGVVKITNLRTLIGTTTYAMSDIKSVNLTRQAKTYRPFWLVIGGILLIAWALIDETTQFGEFFNIGMLLVIVGITLFVIAKPSYAVQIGSTSGETSILRSTDINFIQKIVNAMNSALARRE